MAKQEQKKPNILIMWGDDIGMWNVSRYSQGMMGYRTPNIDRIGEEEEICGVRLSSLDNLETDPSEALWRIRISSFGFRIFLRERYPCPYWTKVQ
jgi:hypothetical protein